MRGTVGKSLRAKFAAELAARLPKYRPVSQSECALYDGERAFCDASPESPSRWIFLVPSGKDDQFTVELGSSTSGEYPQPAERRRIGAICGLGDRWWHIDRFMRTPEAKDILGSINGLESDPATRIQVCVISALVLTQSAATAFFGVDV